jgi:hypothetical protein
LSIGQPLGELHHRHQRQPPRGFSRSSAPSKQRRKAGIVVDRPDRVAELDPGVACRKRGASNASGLVRDRSSGWAVRRRSGSRSGSQTLPTNPKRCRFWHYLGTMDAKSRRDTQQNDEHRSERGGTRPGAGVW